MSEAKYPSHGREYQREYYKKYLAEHPEQAEKHRQRCREWYEKHKNDPEFKAKRAERQRKLMQKGSVGNSRRGEFIELRKQGYTYREIGEIAGISKQRVQQIIGNEPTRLYSIEVEKIAYEGIYQLFMQDAKMTYQKFARIAFGYEAITHANNERIRRFARGESDVKLTLSQIKNILDYIGKPFEEVFKSRKGEVDGNQLPEVR